MQWSSGLPGLVPIAFIYVRDKPRLWSPSASNAVQLKPTTAREEPTKIATNGLHLTCSRKARANELSSVSVTVCAERGRGGQRRRGKYETPSTTPNGAPTQWLCATESAPPIDYEDQREQHHISFRESSSNSSVRSAARENQHEPKSSNFPAHHPEV